MLSSCCKYAGQVCVGEADQIARQHERRPRRAQHAACVGFATKDVRHCCMQLAYAAHAGAGCHQRCECGDGILDVRCAARGVIRELLHERPLGRRELI
eukprot:2121458-Prymnesium_polylepis.1